MRTSNPAFSEKALRGLAATGTEPMTVSGAVQKSLFLILLVIASAGWAWSQAFPQGWSAESVPQIPAWYFIAIFGAFILAMVIIFKQTTAPYLAPVYALLEGVALGAISAIFEYQYSGIVVQAIFGTFGVFIAMLLAYQSGLIKATEKFKLGVVAATGGIAVIYIIDLVLQFFGLSVPYLHDSGPMGIGISVVIVVVAALNLILDFDFIEQGAARRAPKYMEWYGAFGLLITLVWLYLEILRLLAKSRR